MSNEPDATPPTTSDTPATPTEPTPGLLDDAKPAEADVKPDDKSLLDDEGGSPDDAPPAFGIDEVSLDGVKEFVPEGFELNEEQFSPFLERVNGAESRADFAKIALESLAEYQTQQETAVAEAWHQTQEQWKQEVQNHPELGGDNFAKSIATARQVVETYASDPAAVKDFLRATGAGNNVHMIGLLNKLAAAIPGEAAPVEGTPVSTDKSRAEKLFG